MTQNQIAAVFRDAATLIHRREFRFCCDALTELCGRQSEALLQFEEVYYEAEEINPWGGWWEDGEDEIRIFALLLAAEYVLKP